MIESPIKTHFKNKQLSDKNKLKEKLHKTIKNSFLNQKSSVHIEESSIEFETPFSLQLPNINDRSFQTKLNISASNSPRLRKMSSLKYNELLNRKDMKD